MPAKYALLTYKAHPEYNVGDYIQSLAAAQFLPSVDKYINREKLSSYNDEQVKMILNGWFMHLPENWPPSNKIEPLLTSFHLNCQVKEKLLSPNNIHWFHQHAPVGCRDIYTYNLMQEAGIDSYLSGCLTSTLVNKWNYRTEDVIFSDVLFRVPDWSPKNSSAREWIQSIFTGGFTAASQRQKLLTKLFDTNLTNKAIHLHHYHTARHTERQRFAMAEDFLKKFATAKLVVTSRLHCAIPCLAFNTPVIFVNCGFHRDYDACRMEGVCDLFNTISIDREGKITANFNMPEKITEDFKIANPQTFMQYVPELKRACESFVNAVPQPL